MRVNPGASPTIQNTQTEGLKKSEQTAKTDRAKQIEQMAKSQGSSPARAEISDKGKELAKAHAVAKSSPDVREERIAALKARIADGSYKVDADAIADKMLKEHAAF